MEITLQAAGTTQWPPPRLQMSIDMVVRQDLPRLWDDLHRSQEETAGEPVFVLKDPVTGRFFRLLPWLRLCFTPTFLVYSTMLIAFAVGLTVLNGDQIQRDAAPLYRFDTLVLIWLTILCVDLLHELAHGLTCKRFGGEVHELGFMLVFFQPAFY